MVNAKTWYMHKIKKLKSTIIFVTIIQVSSLISQRFGVLFTTQRIDYFLGN